MTLDDLTLWQRRLNLTYQPVTVANKILTIKSLFSFATKVGYLPTNVGAWLKSPKLKDKLAERILSPDEVTRLIGGARNERDRCLLCLLYGCGLRVSEACQLTWNDLKNGKMTVFGKGGKTRVVVVPDWLWSMLMSLPRVLDSVFVSRWGKPLERTMVHLIVKKAAISAGVNPKVSTHWLRHSHASHAIENGCNLRLLQQSLGHSQLETTERYVHVNPDEGSGLFIEIGR